MSNDHPYRHAPDRAFWSKSVSANFDPAITIPGEGFLIRKGDRIVSAGSCFASNLAPYLEKAGLVYLRTEAQHPALAAAEDDNFGYAKFSARYGNIYTVRQLLQLLRRALGKFTPAEDRWHINGEVIDPFRPGLRYPARSNVEFDALAAQHLRATKRAFEQADVFVLTMGLTEAWVSRIDGAVFPACPGTIAGSFDPARHVFHNFSVAEITDDLHRFIVELRAINPTVRFILTVSPVPLVATATGNHVLCATVYSKSVLRVAAQDAADRHPTVTYFPVYEIVTGPQAPADYFEVDRRSVSARAVDIIMDALLTRCEMSIPHPLKESTQLIHSASTFVVMAECEEAMTDTSSL